MRLLLTLLITSSLFGQAMPDPKITPGAIRTTDAKEICAPSFRTTPYRHTTPAMKAKVYAEYARKKKPGVCCEVDHLVPLELGGLDDIRNLWPQPYSPIPGAHQKDLVENRLHKMVCSGEIGLPEAQAMLRTNWYAAYKKLGFAKEKKQ